MVRILTVFSDSVPTTIRGVAPSPAPHPAGGELLNWLSIFEPWSWLATIIGTVLGLGTVFAFISRRYASSPTARRRRLKKQLSQLKLGTPATRVYELVGQHPTKASSLEERQRPGGGRLETFEFPDADLKIVVENGIVELFSVRTKSSKFRMALHGQNETPSLVVGAATFGDVPRRAVSYHGLCNGSSKRMNWYYERRDHMGEADPNAWVYGWTPYGFTRDPSWWFNHLPRWLSDGPTSEVNLTPEKVEALEAFRLRMPINTVVALRHNEPTPSYGLSAYL